MRYALYDTATGRIIQLVTGEREAMQSLVGPDRDLVLTDIDDPAAARISLPDLATVPFPPKSSPVAEWDWQAGAWSDPRTLGQHKLDKFRELQAARSAEAEAGFTVAGNVLPSDSSSQTRILLGLASANANPSTFSEPWLLRNGTRVTLNATQIRAVAQALFDFIKGLDQRLYQHRQDIAAATTIPEVEAIVW